MYAGVGINAGKVEMRRALRRQAVDFSHISLNGSCSYRKSDLPVTQVFVVVLNRIGSQLARTCSIIVTDVGRDPRLAVTSAAGGGGGVIVPGRPAMASAAALPCRPLSRVVCSAAGHDRCGVTPHLCRPLLRPAVLSDGLQGEAQGGQGRPAEWPTVREHTAGSTLPRAHCREHTVGSTPLGAHVSTAVV